MRTTALLCLLYLMSPLAWGDGRSAQQLSEVGSRSRLLCASAMVYFNPQERSPDPRSLTAVFHPLNTLEPHVLQLGQPDLLAQPLRVLKALFAELDRLPRAQRERYPELVRQLLVAHRQQQDNARAQGGAERYLSRAVLDLDELAMTVLEEQS